MGDVAGGGPRLWLCLGGCLQACSCFAPSVPTPGTHLPPRACPLLPHPCRRLHRALAVQGGPRRRQAGRQLGGQGGQLGQVQGVAARERQQAAAVGVAAARLRRLLLLRLGRRGGGLAARQGVCVCVFEGGGGCAAGGWWGPGGLLKGCCLGASAARTASWGLPGLPACLHCFALCACLANLQPAPAVQAPLRQAACSFAFAHPCTRASPQTPLPWPPPLPSRQFDPRFLKFLKRTGQLVQQPELRTMVAVLRNGGLDVHQLEPGTTLRDLLRVYGAWCVCVVVGGGRGAAAVGAAGWEVGFGGGCCCVCRRLRHPTKAVPTPVAPCAPPAAGGQSLSQQQVVVNRQLETNAGAVLATGDIVDIYCEPEEPVPRPAAPGPVLPLRAAPAAGQQQQQPEVVVVLPRGVRSGVVPAAGLVGRLTARAAQQRAQA